MTAPYRTVLCAALAASCTRAAAPATSPPPTPAVASSPATSPRDVSARAPVLEPGATPPGSVTAAGRVTAPSSRTGAPTALPAPAPAATPVTVRVATFTAAEGEDGLGHTVPAPRPVAIELESPTGWPGRALTLTLEVGALRFYQPGYATPTLLRFVAADGAALPRDVEVALSYDRDGASRRVLASSLPGSP